MIQDPLRSMLLGGAVGLAVALAALDPQFITGTGGMWSRPQNDVVSYLVAWNYFLADAWRLPLFGIPAMGYPEGGSVLFNDALPLLAAVSKLLYSLVGARINPFGWWILLTYVLQGAMAARLVHAAGARSAWAACAGAALAVCSWPFLWRLHLGHLALTGHFLILWALALHFESARRAGLKALELFALAATALLVNPYLFAMTLVIAAASALSLWSRGRLGVHDLRRAAFGAAGLVAIAIVAGYGVLFTNPSRMQALGFGVFSWNLVGLLVPPEGVLGFLRDIPRDATSGQYEGESYIGHGALLLLLLGPLAAPRDALRAVRRHAWLCALLLLMAIYAATNRVYLGQTLVLSFDLPPFVADLCQYFRASGRFIWPLAYGLTVLPVAFVFRSWRRAPAIALTLVAVMLQVADARAALARSRAASAAVQPDLLERGLVEWIGQHERLWLYPSWECGSLGGPERPWLGTDAHRELQVQLAASRAALPINSVYAARSSKDCAAEAEWGRRPAFEHGVLYFLGPAAARDSEPLAALVRAGPCVTFPWAIVCSTTSPFPAAR